MTKRSTKPAAAVRSLRVTIIGSGTSIPSPGRRPPSFAIDVTCDDGARTTVLVDAGAGASTGLAEAGIGLDALDHVLLTHFHLDHTAELAPLLFTLRNRALPARQGDVWIRGPAGTRAHLDGLAELYGDWMTPLTCALHVGDVAPDDVVEAGPIRGRAVAVEHSGPSLGYRLEVGGKVVALSGDSAHCDALVTLARGADLFICECGRLESEPVKHLTAEEAGDIAARAGCRNLVLTHLYPWILEADPLAAVARRYAGPTHLGFDGMTWDALL